MRDRAWLEQLRQQQFGCAQMLDNIGAHDDRAVEFVVGHRKRIGGVEVVMPPRPNGKRLALRSTFAPKSIPMISNSGWSVRELRAVTGTDID